MRFLLGRADRKYSEIRHSLFVRHKLGVRLLLSKKGVPRENRLPSWGKGRDLGLLSSSGVAELLRPFFPGGLSGLRDRAREQLRMECQSAATCTLQLWWGRSASVHLR